MSYGAWTWTLGTRKWEGRCLGCGQWSTEPTHFIGIRRTGYDSGYSAAHPGCIKMDKGMEDVPMVDLLENGYVVGNNWYPTILPRLPWAQSHTPAQSPHNVFVTHEQLRQNRESLCDYMEKELLPAHLEQMRLAIREDIWSNARDMINGLTKKFPLSPRDFENAVRQVMRETAKRFVGGNWPNE